MRWIPQHRQPPRLQVREADVGAAGVAERRRDSIRMILRSQMWKPRRLAAGVAEVEVDAEAVAVMPLLRRWIR